MNQFSEPIFTAQIHTGGTRACGLFELFALIDSQELIDLPNMSAHQRPGVETVLAVLMHLLPRYHQVQRNDPESWRAAWVSSLGTAPLRLIANASEVAFLQPPTDEPTSQQSIEAADLLLPNVEHEVKCTWSTSPERAVFALMGSLLRPNVKDHRSSSRVGLTAVLPSDDGSMASEVCNLAKAFDGLFTGQAEGGLADHLVWLQSYRPKIDQPISFEAVPRPLLDVGRALRIRRNADGGYEIWACPNNGARMDGSDPWLDDPHTPKLVNTKGVSRYKLGAKSFDHRFEHNVLFGSVRPDQEIVRPRILDLTKYRVVRLCALGSEQGKTLGYREAMFSATTQTQLFSLEPPAAEDRPARLSARSLDTISRGEKILYGALAEMFREGGEVNETGKHRIAGAVTHFRSIVGSSSVQLVFELLNGKEDLTEEQRRLDQLAAGAVRASFDLAATALISALAVAKAETRLFNRIKADLKGSTMTPTKVTPPLARQTYAIVQEIAAHLTPDDRARLRTMSTATPPLAFWKLMANVPLDQCDNPKCIATWLVALSGMGHISHGRQSFGRALQKTEFPETRMSRLLEVTGASLAGLLSEAIRWLISHNTSSVDFTIPLTLGLADALGEREARDWARREMALDYVRAGRPPRDVDKDEGGSIQSEEEPDVHSDSYAS